MFPINVDLHPETFLVSARFGGAHSRGTSRFKQAPGSVVKLVKQSAQYQLLVNGKPFFIKGAGGDGSHSLLAASGGNSFRTWGADNLEPQLEEAQRLGLKVTIGIWLGHLEHGFRYDNPKMVAEQLEQAKGYITRYRNSPALLMWALGNEEEGEGNDPLIYKAVEDIAAAAKRLDPNHPTMTVIAELGSSKVQNINRYCPDIDIVGINSYGGAPTVAKRYRENGGIKPYVITEFGPAGPWEAPKTAWGAAFEPTSSQKAETYRNDYKAAVLSEPDLCLGSYAFLWGHKQEGTSTWFGMMLPDGMKLEPVETMSALWSGKPEVNRYPRIDSLKLLDSPEGDAGSVVHARLEVKNPEGATCHVKWVVQREAGAYGTNGDPEGIPPTYPDAIVSATDESATVKLPNEPVGFRLFAYIDDGHGRAAVGNIPLHTRPTLSGAVGRAAQFPFYVYASNQTKLPFSPSGWMGDTGALHLDPADTMHGRLGRACLRVELDESSGWAGVAWQSPAGDWGLLPGGFDLTGIRSLKFWAKGAKGGEKVSFGVGLLGPEKRYFDTAIVKLPDVVLSTDWTEYSIDLTGRDLRRIKTGFVAVVAAQGSPVRFFLDDVRFVKD